MAKQLKGGHIGAGVGAMVGGAALTAATFGGAAIFNTVTDQASKITDTNRKAKAVNVNTNALLALNQYGLEHGVDSSVEQRQDNLKDVQERLGETVGNTKWDAKKVAGLAVTVPLITSLINMAGVLNRLKVSRLIH